MLGQNLSGHRPITLKTAIELARAFKCSLSDISPRIAKAMAEVQGVEIGEVPQAPPDLETSLRVVADAFAAVPLDLRQKLALNISMIITDPATHALDQIPIVVRKLSRGPAESGVANAAAPEHQEELDRLSREAEEQHVNSAKRRRVSRD